MNPPAELSATDLASLLCSKVCHDIINPVGAIVNGLEVLADDDNGEMRDIAMDLLQKSAESTASRLKFARLAFGAAGSAGASLDLGEIKGVAHGYVTTDRVTMEWQSPMGLLPKDEAKLLLNLIMISQSTITRGGTLAITIEDDLEAPVFIIKTDGKSARVPENLEDLFFGHVDIDTLDARSIQPYFAGLIGRSVSADVAFRQIDEQSVVISSRISR